MNQLKSLFFYYFKSNIYKYFVIRYYIAIKNNFNIDYLFQPNVCCNRNNQEQNEFIKKIFKTYWRKFYVDPSYSKSVLFFGANKSDI